jgi:hypothetical protein
MALIRWNPGTELMNLHSEMDRLFEELAGDMGMARWTNGNGGTAQAFVPSTSSAPTRRWSSAPRCPASTPTRSR